MQRYHRCTVPDPVGEHVVGSAFQRPEFAIKKCDLYRSGVAVDLDDEADRPLEAVELGVEGYGAKPHQGFYEFLDYPAGFLGREGLRRFRLDLDNNNAAVDGARRPCSRGEPKVAFMKQ
jgi:hypothetical protein